MSHAFISSLVSRFRVPEKPVRGRAVKARPRRGDEGKVERRREAVLRIVADNPNLDSAIVRLREEIRAALGADKCVVYRKKNNALLNPYAGGSPDDPRFEYNSLRIAPDEDLAGFVAVNRQPLLILNVYDGGELARIGETLRFDDQWDAKHGVRTRSAMVAPAFGPDGGLMAVIQVQNMEGSELFSKGDLEGLKSLASALGEALYLKVGKLPDYLLHLVPRFIDEATLRNLVVTDGDPWRLYDQLMEHHGVPPGAIGEVLSRRHDCPFVAFDTDRPPPHIAEINPAYLRKNLWVPVAEGESGEVVVAIDNPSDPNRTSEVTLLLPGRRVEFRVALRRDILRWIDALEGVGGVGGAPRGDIEGALERLDFVTEEDEAQAQGEDVSLAGLESDSPAIQLVDSIILEGVHKSASDIHMEPVEIEEGGRRKRVMRVRYRIDGECTSATVLPIQVARAVMARIKIMSRLDTSERRLPQSGKIKIKGMNIELRVETCPTSLGEEKAVLRILASKLIPLEKLITNPEQFRRFRRIITRPHGIVLVVGPTGSGKTTTLHAALHARNEPGINIITAEDPVEITQPGITQVQVNYDIDLTFPAILRSFLRQDPDIVMVGEIRDGETARIALEAAQTGHLVFSTLHTNSAPETVTRLFDLGLDPYYFASAISGILAQRLVRKLCDECKRPRVVEGEELEAMIHTFGEEEFAVVIGDRAKLTVYEPVGCETCGDSGYRGRLGIHEIMDKSPAIVELIQRKAATPELKAQAMRDGMRTLFQDGMRNVVEGLTSWEEVVRVCSSED